MALTKKYVYNKIIETISDNLKVFGFQFVKSKDRIIRKHEDGFDAIIVKVVDYNPVFQIELYFRSRIDCVENIINKYQANISNNAFLLLSETCSANYQELSGAKMDFIEVKNENELDKAIHEIKSLIEAKVMSFYDQNRDIHKLNNIKKKQILENHQDISLYHNRRSLMQSLILMRLCNDPDFNSLKDKYKKLYVPFVGEEEVGKKAINDLIIYLENNY